VAFSSSSSGSWMSFLNMNELKKWNRSCSTMGVSPSRCLQPINMQHHTHPLVCW
jgi:hypothetical protein